MIATAAVDVDLDEVRRQIRAMYRDVARDPGGDFHFEMGRALAKRLGYPPEWLDAVPAEALASYAGVGHMLDLAQIGPGDRVLDLGSGAGTDAFVAGHLVGPSGAVVGVDMTEEQLGKARTLRDVAGLQHVCFLHAYVEEPPVEPESFDAVISNGVLNLVPDKARAFAAAADALRPGGRLAIADIVSARELRPRTRANTQLWAACIAGSVPLERYVEHIRDAGLSVEAVRLNPNYRFVSQRALEAVAIYGVVSVSIQAVKPA
ncbi:MAG TPA: methyltransferase domain-containing protein [Capillimicrobium sp.]|nr:methyltransferase domain-containing protein [Capillimicrobium sp.]